jgi:ligand-binding sensor domain-containing protein
MSKSQEFYQLLLCFILSFFFIPSLLLAEETALKFRKLTIDDGLSQNAIQCIIQDRQGFMWFGSKDGLNRYDGRDFRVYNYSTMDSNNISNGYILSLCEDREGYIWVGTSGGGLNRFDPYTEKFTRFQHNPEDSSSLSHNVVNSIIQDKAGTIWIGTNGGGLNKCDMTSGKFIHYRNDPANPRSLSNDLVKTILEDKQGNLWIGTHGGGLNRWDVSQGEFYRYSPNPGVDINSYKDNVFALAEDRDGIIWVGSGGSGLFKFDKTTENFTRVSTASLKFGESTTRNIVRLLADNENALWIVTNGFGLLKLKDDKFYHYIYESDNPEGLSANSVQALYFDRSGILWVGTNGQGLNYTSAYFKKFTTYGQSIDNPRGMSFSSVRALYEDQKGYIWVGGYGGINRLERKSNEFLHVLSYGKSGLSGSEKSNSINAAIYCIQPDFHEPERRLWLGTEGGGLFRLDISNFKIENFNIYDRERFAFPVGSAVFTLLNDEQGYLWLGTEKALNKLNPKDRTNAVYEYKNKIGNEFLDSMLKALIRDSQGMFWLGFETNGLVSFDRKYEKFTCYSNKPDDPTSLSNNRVYCIYEDSKKRLWIGTAGGGLNLFQRDKGTFIHYMEKDGLPNDVVNAILEDSKGNLWLSTNKGLSKFNPEASTFENYDVSDGLQSNEFNHGARFKSKSGELFFGGIAGFTCFYPDSIRKNPYIPPVIITDLKIFNLSVPIGKKVKNREILNKGISFTDEIHLSHVEKFFTLEFSALNYLQPFKNQYAYKMEGFEDNWNFVGNNRFATYTNLAPGKYTFHVKASNNDGVWNENGTSIKIIITPPFWQTWWFRTIVVIFVISVLVAIYLWRVNRIQQTAIRLEAMVKERTSELEEAMNNIKVLKGLIPICASCKKVRDDSGFWRQVEDYISHHSEAQFSHGICPDCMKKLYPQFYKEPD